MIQGPLRDGTGRGERRRLYQSVAGREWKGWLTGQSIHSVTRVLGGGGR